MGKKKKFEIIELIKQKITYGFPRVMNPLFELILVWGGAILILLLCWYFVPEEWKNNVDFSMSIGAGIVSGLLLWYLISATNYLKNKSIFKIEKIK